MWKWFWVCGLLVLASLPTAQGQGELVLSDQLIHAGVEVLVQPSVAEGSLYDSLRQRYGATIGRTLPLGIESKSAKWITGAIYNRADTSIEVFFLSYRLNIQCWQIDPDDTLSGFYLAGPDAPFVRGTPIEERHSFRVTIPPGSQYVYRLAFSDHSNDIHDFSLFAYDRATIYQKSYQTYFGRRSYLYIYMASMAIICFQILFALLLWAIIRNRMYLLYAFYILPLAISLHIQYADFIYIPIPFSQIVLDPFAHSMYFISFGFYFLFADRFLHISQTDHVGKKLIQVALTAIAIYIPIHLVIYFAHYKTITFVWYMSFSLLLFVLSIWLIKRVFVKKDPSSRLLIIGSLFFITGAITNVLSSLTLSIWDQTLIKNFSINFFFFAVPAELLFFSSAIAYKFRQDEIQKTRASEALVEKMKENELLNLQIQDMRDRIARDLHDDIGATLSSIALYSEVAFREGSSNQATRGILEKISSQAREMVGRMSDVVWAIQPRNEGIEALIRKLDDAVATLLGPAEIGWEMNIPDKITPIPLTIEQKKNIILIFREAINNIAKHSGASFVTIALHFSDAGFGMEISDNGRGFDYEAVRQGNGLLSMKKRAEECNGLLKIQSHTGTGTTLIFRLPTADYKNAD